ncbi:MAG TPA: hypothetical protein VKE42_04520, partial [Candidatus Cybelea sp.]|nr:hypothetical protein [Candidatus Cybelea sp.]
MATDETALTTLAHEVARLSRDLAALASVVATEIEARKAAQQLPAPTPIADQPAIMAAQAKPSSEELQKREWLASLPCNDCKHPYAGDVR